MGQIDDLRAEIKSFEDEIASLQAELTAVGGFTMQLASSNAPSEIAKSIRTEAQQVLERQPAIKGLRDAITELTSRLQQKRLELQELEAVELKRETKRRVEEGRSRLHSKFSDVEKMAESLQNLYFDLKAIALEYEKDFAQIHPPSSGHKQLNRAALLNYELLWLPQLTEESDRFILHSKVIDIFEAERKAIERERLENSLAWRQNHQQQMAENKQRELDKQLRIEREDAISSLKVKTSELEKFKKARADRLTGLKTARTGDLDDAIAKLEEEIEDLEKPMQP
jgi:hypothetical protein